MALLGGVFLFLGVTGLVFGTIGGAGLAWLFSQFYTVRPLSKRSTDGISIEILIAAHNEEKQITHTLESVANERLLFLRANPAQVGICVGLDHCTDETESLVVNWASSKRTEIRLINNPSSQGKWNILWHLVSQSEADWVALVDVGAAWEPGLLAEVSNYVLNDQVSGVAPSYGAIAAGVLERISWSLERFIKTLEGRAGGSISVHGSTVLYRRSHLIRVYEMLNHERPLHGWLNDDIVLPLMLRILFPLQRIVYLSQKNGIPWVHDHGLSQKTGSEMIRRKRIIVGNLQWVKAFYIKAIRSSPIVGLIASRRVFRMFWSYWIVSVMAGVTLLSIEVLKLPTIPPLLILAFLIGVSRLHLQGSFGRLRAAFWAGLELPLYYYSLEEGEKVQVWS